MASGTERHSSNVLEAFTITVKYDDLSLHPRELQGYRINIPDCPEAKLFVHESHTKDGKWCVTEENSGFCICTGASKPAAVGRARRIIIEKYDKFVIAVKNAIAVKASGKADPDPEDATQAPAPAIQPAKVVKAAAKPKKQ